MSARDRILGRIRAARGVGAGVTDAERATVENFIRAKPRGVGPAMPWEIRPRFREQCITMASTYDEVATRADVPDAVERYLREKALPLTAVAWPEIASMSWTGLKVEGRPARGDDLVGITGVHLAIAETGTLMFLSGAETYAATSLLPETHIAVVPADRIVASMEDAWARTRDETSELPRAVNFVSGPSRTADIEGVLQIGAHGPFRVHVIVVTG